MHWMPPNENPRSFSPRPSLEQQHLLGKTEQMDKQERNADVFGAPEPSIDSVSKQDNHGSPAFEPRSINYKTADDNYGQYVWRNITSSARYVIPTIIIGALLSIPVIIYRDYQDILPEPIDPKAERSQLLFFVFAWLLISWLSLWTSFALGTALPYTFRLITRYTAPF